MPFLKGGVHSITIGMSLVWQSNVKHTPGTHVLIVGVGSYPHFLGYTGQKKVGQVEMSARSAFRLAN